MPKGIKFAAVKKMQVQRHIYQLLKILNPAITQSPDFYICTKNRPTGELKITSTGY